MISAAEVRLLTELGFVAAGRGDVVHARPIFDALRPLRPGQASAQIGLPLALLNAGQSAEAVVLLQRALAEMPDGPDGELVQALLGLALQVGGRQGESRRVLRQLAGRRRESNDPSDGLRLGLALLGEPVHAADAAMASARRLPLPAP